MESDLLAVITVNLNNEKGLAVTIQSVQNAKRALVWIFVDGGSSDGSAALAQAANMPNKVLLVGPDSGIYDAMNKGIKAVPANCSHVVFINSGDSLGDTAKIFEGVNASNAQPPEDIILFAATETNVFGIRLKQAKQPRYIYYGMPAHHQAIVYRNSYLSTNLFDTSYKLAGDYAHLCTAYVSGARMLRCRTVAANFVNDGRSVFNADVSRAEASRARREILKVNPIINYIIIFVQTAVYRLKMAVHYFG